MHLQHRVGFLALCLGSLFANPCAQAQHLQWIRQLGSAQSDQSYGVFADSLGNVYISGRTDGSLDGPKVGLWDAFVSKYDASGSLYWTRQLGTTADDYSYGVSADALGNVYISGSTRGNLGGPNAGSDDAFLSKYDAAGSLQWTRQLGIRIQEVSTGVSVDSLGNVYISGYTYNNYGPTVPRSANADSFVSKYDTSGNELWTLRMQDNSYDFGNAVHADTLGNVYISGYGVVSEEVNVRRWGAFASKIDSTGVVQWTRQLGTTEDRNDRGFGVSSDALGNVYIAGIVGGNVAGPTAGSDDAFVSKYDASGSLLWTRQLGTTADDRGYGVSADALGNIYVAGYTGGNLGATTGGNGDAFLSKYNTSGNQQWIRQLGTAAVEDCRGVSADALGNVYIAGYTFGNLDGTSAGSFDAFVAKYSPIPEPAPSAWQTLAGAFLLLWRARPAASRSAFMVTRHSRAPFPAAHFGLRNGLKSRHS